MYRVQLHLASGTTISAMLDPPLIDKLIGDLLALPGVVPRLLIELPTRDELGDRAARLRLVAVALGELLSRTGQSSSSRSTRALWSSTGRRSPASR